MGREKRSAVLKIVHQTIRRWQSNQTDVKQTKCRTSEVSHAKSSPTLFIRGASG